MIKLYVIPGSHPCVCVEAALKLKQLEYETVNLLPVIHKAVQRLIFDQNTVPGLRTDGVRIVGSKRIMRYLDLLEPAPRLYPEDPTLLKKVEEAEEWGDSVLQPIGRRLLWAGFSGNRSALRSYAEGTKLPVPLDLAMLFSPIIVKASSALNGATEERVRSDLRELESHLQRADRLIETGVIGGEQPNAADLQIASNLRVLMSLEDLSDIFGDRPAAKLALKLFPDYRGQVPEGSFSSTLLAETKLAERSEKPEKQSEKG